MKKGRSKKCGSVFMGEDGNFYSYGYHYPLLFKVNNTPFVNIKKYSGSTSAHSTWAREVLPQAFPIILQGDSVSEQNIKESIQIEQKELVNKLVKARKASQEKIVFRMEQLERALCALENNK